MCNRKGKTQARMNIFVYFAHPKYILYCENLRNHSCGNSVKGSS